MKRPIVLERDGLLELNRDFVVRFLRKVNIPIDPTSNPCWVWTSAIIGSGYPGIFAKLPNRAGPIYAHRVAYALQYSSMPTELQASHDCHNRLCVNPSHIRPTSDLENKDEGKIYKEATDGIPPENLGLSFSPFDPWEGFGLPVWKAHFERHKADTKASLQFDGLG